jgi:hypothetical protein
MSTGQGIALAGLLIAGAIAFNGYMERRPYNRAFDNCMAELEDAPYQETSAEMKFVCMQIAAQRSP